MSWYLRKAIKLGPIRLNLSKSGLGVSAGVRGARISVGPGGTRLHAGRHGVYFRQRLDRGGSDRPRDGERQLHDTGLREIATADASALVDPDRRNLIRELRERQSRMAFAPVILVAGILLIALLCALALQVSPLWWITVAIATPASALLTYHFHHRDLDRKTVTLEFELDHETEGKYRDLQESLSRVASCHNVWRITSERFTSDWKRHAGANCLVNRNPITICRTHPPYLRSNVTPYAVKTRSQTLYFFPDAVFVYQGRTVGIVPYHALEVHTGCTEFREEGCVPGDATVTGTTWRYYSGQ